MDSRLKRRRTDAQGLLCCARLRPATLRCPALHGRAGAVPFELPAAERPSDGQLGSTGLRPPPPNSRCLTYFAGRKPEWIGKTTPFFWNLEGRKIDLQPLVLVNANENSFKKKKCLSHHEFAECSHFKIRSGFLVFVRHLASTSTSLAIFPIRRGSFLVCWALNAANLRTKERKKA